MTSLRQAATLASERFAQGRLHATLGNRAATGLRQLATEYIDELELRGRSAITAERYSAYVATFLGWLGFQAHKPIDDLAPEEVTDERLRGYLLFLSRRRDRRNGRTVGPATRNLYLIALRNYLRYCSRRGAAVPDPEETLRLAKERDVEIRHLRRDEIERITGAVDLSHSTGVRDRAIIEALFGAGVRVSELAAMTIRQVDLSRREVEVVGKGGRSRLVLLTEDSAAWVERYLATRSDDEPALFVGRNGKRLRPLGIRRIQQIVEAAALRAGLPFKVSPHWFRHSRLTALARYAGVQVAQRIAGHSSLQTTARYLHVTDSQLRQLYDRAEDEDRG